MKPEQVSYRILLVLGLWGVLTCSDIHWGAQQPQIGAGYHRTRRPGPWYVVENEGLGHRGGWVLP